MNSIGAGAVGGSNGCTVSGGAVGGADAVQPYGAGAAGLSGLLNPGTLLCSCLCLWSLVSCGTACVPFHVLPACSSTEECTMYMPDALQ